MRATQSTPLIYKCQRCGRQSPIEAAFVIRKGKNGSLARCLCFACEQKRATNSTLLLYILLPVFGMVILLLNPTSQLGFFALLVCASLLVSIPLIVLHELSHALAAQAFGFRVFAVHVGIGKVLFTKRICGIAWTIHLIPSSGVTLIAGPEMENYKARIFLIHLAGPLFHAVLNALLIWINRWFGISGLWYDIVLWTNVGLLLMNLLPYKGHVAVGSAGTDGWAMLNVPGLSPQALQTRYASFYMLESISAAESGDMRAALAFAKQGVARYPENMEVRNVLGYVYVHSGDYQNSREIFLQALQTNENLAITTKALLLNNVAFANLMLDDPALLPEADDFSEQACQLLPWEPATCGTRGGVLVALGQVDQGLELLKSALKKNPDKRGKAIDACLIAWGEWLRGQAEKADSHLALARQLDPKCLLLDRIQEKISGPSRAMQENDLEKR